MQKTMKKKNAGHVLKTILSSYSHVLVFVALFIIYYLISSSLSWTGMTNILRHSAVIGIISFGMGIVIISGEIDLSVGSMLAFVSSITIVVFNLTDSVPLLLLTALVVGALSGFINGLLVGKAKMPAFIVTLATMLILRSLVQYACHVLPNKWTGGGNNLYKLASTDAKNGLFSFGNSKVASFPMTGIILIIISIIIVYITTSTKLGKKLYAVGSNTKAAKLAGVDTVMVKVGVFTLCGLFVGIASFLWISMNGAVDPATTGRSNEMYAIAACVLGGLSMAGGKGKFLGILFGAMSYTIIDKIIAAVRVQSLINDAIKGTILIIAILLQTVHFDRSKIKKHNKSEIDA